MAHAQVLNARILMNVYRKQLIVIPIHLQIKVLLVSILLDHLLVNVKMDSCRTRTKSISKEHLPSHTAMTFQNAKTISILVSKMRTKT